jgi:hypothetical protein
MTYIPVPTLFGIMLIPVTIGPSTSTIPALQVQVTFRDGVVKAGGR